MTTAVASNNITLVTHGPISINGNADLANQAVVEGWPGNGTAANPYIIEGHDIMGSVAHSGLITTSNTDVYCIIKNSLIHDSTAPGGSGTCLHDVTNASITCISAYNNSHGFIPWSSWKHVP